MKIEDRSAIFRAAGASPRTRLPKVTGLAPGALTTGPTTNRQSTLVLSLEGFDNRHLAVGNRHSRRGSALVLVMTLLGILFVLGVAFMASMNFEADMIASQTQRHRAESRVNAVVDQLGSTLRDGLMSDPRMPFGDPSTALSPTAFAEMPGVQNSFSPIEPYRDDNGTATLSDDRILFPSFTDLVAAKQHPFTGPSLPQPFVIDTSLPNSAMIAKLPDGTNLKRCLGGTSKGNSCDLPADCPGSVCDGPHVVDADGDGIVDSLQVDAKLLDFSDAQLAALSARLNPPTNPTGKVFVGIRVIPNGGLVNLNASHPKLIENVLDVPPLYPSGQPRDPDYGYFYHRPTQNQVAYSPLLEESTLRRRELLAPRTMPPSWLQGDPLVDPVKYPNGKADMQWQLFAPQPGGAASGKYESVFAHRASPFTPSELFAPANPDLGSLWAVRMEPSSSALADPTGHEYDRRHLVTTVSHDDLLARGGRVANPAVPGSEEDILTKMTQANQAANDPDRCPPLLPNGYEEFPFEYADYPQTIPDDCCPTDVGCKLNARKGRLQLSLPWLDDQFDAAGKLTDPVKKQQALDRVVRLIHDTFFMLVRNAAHVTTLEGTPCASEGDCTYANAVCGPVIPNRPRVCTTKPLPPLPATPVPEFKGCAINPCSIPGSVCRATDGVCTIQALYWQDKPCAAPTDCLGGLGGGEVCDPAQRICVDAWTGQTHSQALISRTAASLTANLIDYADADPGDVPTRIALRSFDFNRGVCAKGTAGLVCDKDADCVGGGANSCLPPARAAGREFDFDPAATTKFEYVYGLERQPYITEVATLADPGDPGSGIPPSLVAWAIEIFNPYDIAIDPIAPNTQYVLIEAKPDGSRNEIALDGSLQPNPKPFSTFVTAPNAPIRDALVGAPPPLQNGNVYPLPAPLPGARPLTFGPDWTLYLIRRVVYPGDSAKVPPYTDVVVDQFEVKGPKIANPAVCTSSSPNDCITTLERVVTRPDPWPATVLPATVWTATVPKRYPREGSTSLGDWNLAVDASLHPVEVNFANLDWFSRPFRNPTNAADLRNGSVSFPTTGSLLMLMRHANRSFPLPGEPIVKDLAFTTALVGVTNTVDSSHVALPIREEEQIDNGRMPIFDLGARSTTPTDPRFYAAHHLSPSVTDINKPGNLDTLPWGQLVFDYFTALPLSNPGPYFVGPGFNPAAPESMPKVDMDGLRVHGRININAAPWKVLAGLPFVPMNRIPTPVRNAIRTRLPGDLISGKTYAQLFSDDQAGTIGEPLAQAIVAYRELRALRPIPNPTSSPGTGNYYDGTPPAGAPPNDFAYARGWNLTLPGPPPVPVPIMARRGTGFMTVGELANVRHLGAADPVYRIDSGVIDPTKPNEANTRNFVDAVAALVALGDWVAVRSQVFTVYGVLRGEEDPTIIDPDLSTPPTQAELRARDVDSRALRFQETIDRLPTFLGQSVPSRIGDRSLSRYTDAHND